MTKTRMRRALLRLYVAAVRPGKTVRALWDWFKEPLAIVAVVYAGAAAFAQPYYVPSGSMQPTLAIGDLLIATKFSYGYTRYSLPFSAGPTPEKQLFARLPEPGDVVVFRKPGRTELTLVKRVVGLPGDRIQMKAGRLWINGREMALRPDGRGKAENGPTEGPEGAYLAVGRYIETLPNGRRHVIFKKMWGADFDETPEVVVPPGHVFVLGDNRDDSADSRVSPLLNGVGMLPAANIVGRARLVVGSVDFVNARGVWEWPLQFRLSRMLNRIR